LVAIEKLVVLVYKLELKAFCDFWETTVAFNVFIIV